MGIVVLFADAALRREGGIYFPDISNVDIEILLDLKSIFIVIENGLECAHILNVK